MGAKPQAAGSARFTWRVLLAATLAAASALPVSAQPANRATGDAASTSVRGADRVELSAALAHAALSLPAEATGAAIWTGLFADMPTTHGGAVATVIFVPDAAGLDRRAIASWQRWLAGLGVASVALDVRGTTAAMPSPPTPSLAQQERLQEARREAIAAAVQALAAVRWADAGRLLLAGSVDGAVAVARYPGDGFAARMIFGWGCEANAFVHDPMLALPPQRALLVVLSADDRRYGSDNVWLGHAVTKAHCGDALADPKFGTIALTPGAADTLFDSPAARALTAGFLRTTPARDGRPMLPQPAASSDGGRR